MFFFFLDKYIEVGIAELYGVLGFTVSPQNSYVEDLTLQYITTQWYLEKIL